MLIAPEPPEPVPVQCKCSCTTCVVPGDDRVEVAAPDPDTVHMARGDVAQDVHLGDVDVDKDVDRMRHRMWTGCGPSPP